MRRIDAFLFRDELDLLECRLTELGSVMDAFVIVEGTRTHGHNTPKPLVYQANAERFAAWADKIIYVIADDLPDSPDPWKRENTQRDYIWQGLKRLDAQPDDIVFQSDVDEIPSAFAAKHVQPSGYVVFEQTLYCFAVDWQHPVPWRGTVAARVADIGSMNEMRDARLKTTTVLPDAGWHLSWLGDADAKMDAFCHQEIEDAWRPLLGDCRTRGIHVDGTKLIPVEVDATWPEYIAKAVCPPEWFR